MTFVIGTTINAQDLTISVKGECEMCKERIEEIAMNTIGVNTAEYDLEANKLKITFTKGLFVETELHNNIANAGHDTNKVKASLESYDALPGCCQYSRVPDDILSGTVYEIENNNSVPVIGANVYWLDSNEGTSTDIDGNFQLNMKSTPNKLVISYVGYNSDTVEISKAGEIDILLDNSVVLNEVEIVYRKKATEISFIDPIKTKKISRKELTKAACCNLSESFETNPSVDVAFTDAVTGTKQIEMLGLAGPYVQINREGMPDIRGLSALDGFTFIPGPWIGGIQMNFGTGSVINGFESVAGQINVELKKPYDEEKLHLNGYANLNGRMEANVFNNFQVARKWRTAIFAHADARTIENDRNDDDFVDNPLSSALVFANRWKWDNGEGHEAQLGFKSTLTNRTSGTVEALDGTSNEWEAESEVQRHELWLKRGMVFKNRPYASLGMMASGLTHNVSSTYGKRKYDGDQKMLYLNLLYSTIIGDTDHKIVMGTSFQGEKYKESFGEFEFEREEWVPGVFAEYSYSIYEKFDAVLGLRGDYNNYFGFFATPRMHLRYAPNENHVFRAIAGRGQRTANIFAENIKAMATNRTWILNNDNSDNPYGFSPEVAWNYGVNYTYLFNVGKRLQTLQLDYYYTDFNNQTVVDYDRSSTEVHFSDLEGKSFSHSIQSQLDLDIIEGLQLRLAYRYNIAKTTLDDKLQWKPLASKHRAFANIGYETKSGWKFDYTVNMIGPKRLPNTSNSPEEYQLDSESPSYWVHNAQVSKVFKRFEVYIGGENIFDFRQKDAIVAADNTQSEYFDASMVWGPIFGRNVYIGFRYNLMNDFE